MDEAYRVRHVRDSRSGVAPCICCSQDILHQRTVTTFNFTYETTGSVQVCVSVHQLLVEPTALW